LAERAEMVLCVELSAVDAKAQQAMAAREMVAVIRSFEGPIAADAELILSFKLL